MPARKTVAAARSEEARKRQQRLLIGIGAIPVIVLVVIVGIFVYGRATALGPNEMPSSIGSKERDEIRDAVQVFFDAVNQYNPQLISEAMVKQPPENGQELQRMIYQVAPLLSEQLKFQISSLGQTTLDSGKGVVNARVATNFGVKDFVLKRNEGFWRVVTPPDLTAPQEAGPLQFTWELTNSFPSDNGDALFVVGKLTLVGAGLGYVASMSAYVNDGGTTISSGTSPLPASPFIGAREDRYFQITLRKDKQFPDRALDPARVVIIPDVRPAQETDEAAFIKKVSVSPEQSRWLPGQMAVNVLNEESLQLRANVFGYLRDASGRVLAVVSVATDLVDAGAVRSFPVDLKLPSALSGIATVEFAVTGQRATAG